MKCKSKQINKQIILENAEEKNISGSIWFPNNATLWEFLLGSQFSKTDKRNKSPNEMTT